MNAIADQDIPKDPEKEAANPPPLARSIKLVDGCMDSRDLFVGRREIIIRHRDEFYRLRLTAQNKLILTK